MKTTPYSVLRNFMGIWPYYGSCSAVTRVLQCVDCLKRSTSKLEGAIPSNAPVYILLFM